MNTLERKDEIISLLQDKEYRDAHVSASINVGVPSQIRVLRKQRKWSQKQLGDEAKMVQESISRIEDPTKSSVNLKTLLKLASAFNVGLIVRFVPFSELVNWKLKLSLGSLEVPSFDKDPYFQTATPTDNKQYVKATQQEVLGKVIIFHKDRRDHLARDIGASPTHQNLRDVARA